MSLLLALVGGVAPRVAVAVDTVTFSDSAVAITNRVAAAVDSVTFSDSAVSLTNRISEATDTVVFSDSAVSFTNRIAVAVDSVTFSDSAVASSNLAALAVDSVTFSDSAVALMNIAAVAVDAVTFSDSAVATVTTGARVAVAADSITFSDSAVAVRVAPIQLPTAGGWIDEPKKRRERRILEDILEAIEEIAPRPLLPQEEVIVAKGVSAVQEDEKLSEVMALLSVEIRFAATQAINNARRAIRRKQEDEFMLVM